MSWKALIRTQLSGWPVALCIVTCAYLTAMLVVPRPADPEGLPRPAVDYEEQLHQAGRERLLAQSALQSLPAEVRALGEALRRLGSAETVQRQPGLHRLQRRNLERLAQATLKRHGATGLLELRALQTHLFLRAARQWAREPAGSTPHDNSPAEAELAQLGGRSFATAKERGWFRKQEFLGTEHELSALYRVHWGRALGLGETYPFSPSLNDWRTHYAFLFSTPPTPGQTEREFLQRQLRYVTSLAAQDSSYPAALAQGILHFQLGDYPAAVGALSFHMRTHPDGPWSLRAKNYLAACGSILSAE